MKKLLVNLLAVVLLFCSALSHAGYYAKVTSYGPGTMNYTAFALDATSACMLTPSMAITALASTTSYYVVTAIGADGTWSAVGQSGGGGQASGVYSECTASPAVAAFPPLAGGVTDPAISGTSVLSGSSGGGSGGSSGDLVALQALVNELQGQLAAVSASNVANSASVGQINAVLNEPFDLTTGMAAFAFFFSTTIFFYGFSRGAGAVLEMVRRPLGRG